jgi:hypothetical protein
VFKETLPSILLHFTSINPIFTKIA